MSSGMADYVGVLLSVLGGLSYGYSVVIVGASASKLLLFLGDDTTSLSLASSFVLIGASVGSPLSGWVCERFGRLRGAIVGELCILAGSILCACAGTWSSLWVGRAILGIGIGFCVLAKPLYIKETVSPARVASTLATFVPSVQLGVLVARMAPGLTSVCSCPLL